MAVTQGRTNVPVEIGFQAQIEHLDPFNTVEMDAIFAEPGGALRRVPAFWAGEDTWKVRYASPHAGTHRWRTECSAAVDAGLNGVSGSLDLAPYDGDNVLYRNGPVQIAPDRRHLQHQDGKPFFWLADTWWMGLCHRLHWPGEFQLLCHDRVVKGFSVIQLVMGLYPDMHPFDERGANEAGYPWERDYTRIRPAYFDAADRRLRYLVDAGLAPCIVGAWGYFMEWMGEAKLAQHWRYLIARYASWPVVWCAAGEANLPWYQVERFPYDDQAAARRWSDVMRFIRATDPWRRPLTVHPTAINSYSARHAVDDEALLDFDFLQTPHDGPDFTVEAAAARTTIQSRACFGTMPVINGESCYEMLLDRIPASKPRAMFWLCMTSGAAGHTYGANGIWQVNRKGAPHGPSPTAGSTGYGSIAWDEAMHLAGGAQIAAGKRWLERIEWWTLQPHFSWAAWDSDSAADAAAGLPGLAEVAPSAIGHTEGARVVYMLFDCPVVLRQLEPGRRYRITHFDPVETTEADWGSLKADVSGQAKLASPGHGHDWVVLVEPE